MTENIYTQNARLYATALLEKIPDGAIGLAVSYLEALAEGMISGEQIDVELQKGYDDMMAGKTKSAAKVFAQMRKDYLA